MKKDLSNFLYELVPQYGNTFNSGQNFENYCYQLYNVDEGAIIKNGPQFYKFYAKCAKNHIAYIVFPNPI